MATDTLEIFGTEYTGVTGIKATDDQSGTKVYIRPQGTKSISANGTGIDVAEYASVDVSVPSGGNYPTFTLDVSQEQPTVTCNKTYAECRALINQSIFSAIVDVPLVETVCSAQATFYQTGYPYIIYDIYRPQDGLPFAAVGYYENRIEYYENDNDSLPSETRGFSSGIQKGIINRSTSVQYLNIPVGVVLEERYYTIPATPDGTAGTPTATKGTVSNHSVSVTPSVTNVTGYITGSTKTGTAVTVSASELVSGSETKTANGTYDVTNLASLVVNVPSGGMDIPVFTVTYDSTWLDVQSVTCNKTYAQCISYYNEGNYSAACILTNGSSESYYGLSVEYIPGEKLYYTYTSNGLANYQIDYTSTGQLSYQPSETIKTSFDLTVNGATITVPYGTYKANATKTIPSGSATAPASISGTAASVSTGTNTLTLTKTVSVTPTVSAGYVSSGTAGNSSVSLTASVITKAAATITPGTTNQTIASGTYLTGTQTIAGDANLVAGNIISGKSIFGVAGSVVLQTVYTGSGTPSSSTGSNGDIYIQS